MIQNLNNFEQAAHWLQSKTRGKLTVDSRQAEAGDAFIAWPGYAHDARAFVATAIDQGAVACLVEQEGIEDFNNNWNENKVASYRGLKTACGYIADAYYEHPSDSIKVLAVTGTNGKTSIAWWLSAALAKLETRCGVIGTLGVGEVSASIVKGKAKESLNNFEVNGLTTPDPLTLQKSLKQFKESGVQYCAIEASSIGIAEHRLGGTKINTAIFTNLSRDHLDYHKNMDDYWSAKSALFELPDLVCAVINVDDLKGKELSLRLKSKNDPKLKIIQISELGFGELNASEISYPNSKGGLGFKVSLKNESGNNQTALINTQLVGRYNVSNLLCVIATLTQLGFEFEKVVKACEDLPPVIGRMERIGEGGATQPIVIVDYAHTPDALEKALLSLRPLTQGGGELHCLIGCGGDRDSGKRPEMAQVAYKHSDKVIFTADNPRTENPQSIINEMLSGIAGLDTTKVVTEPSRSLAIEQLIQQAKDGDVVLLAGKGHENYQEINGVKNVFSDAEEAERVLARLRSGNSYRRCA